MRLQRLSGSGPARLVKRWDAALHTDDAPVVSRIHVTAAVCAAVIAGACSLWVALRQYGPTVHPDEWGFLLNGQVIIGHAEAQIPTNSFYPAGFGVVTGVMAWLTGSISGEYRATLLVNFALCLAVGWLAHRVARNVIGLSRRMSLLAAALVFVAPGTVVSSLYAWPETAARAAFLLFVLGFHRVVRVRSAAAVLLFGLLTGFMPVLHGRFTLVLFVSCLAILWLGWRSDLSRIIAVSSVGLSAAAFMVGRALNAMVKRDLYAESWSQEGRLLKRLVNPTLWPALVRTMTGQYWYLAVTTCGLFAVAAYVVWREARQGPVATIATEPRRMTLTVTGVSVLLLVFTGGLQLLFGNRGDHLIYGRYVEIVVPVVLILGCAGFESEPLRSRRAMAVSTFLVPIVAVTYVLVDMGDGVKGGWSRRAIVYPNIVGFDSLRYLVRPGLLTWGAVGFVVTGVAWFLSRARDSRVLLAMVVLLSTSSVWSITHSLSARADDLRSTTVIPDYVKSHGGSLIAFDGQIPNDAMYYYLRFKIHPLQVVRVYASGTVWPATGPAQPVPQGINCVVGLADRPIVHGEWRIVADEKSMERVLWQRVGTDHC